MKFSKLSAVLLSIGFSVASHSVSAKESYMYCTILADTGSNNYKHILQKNIIKGDHEKDPKITEKIVEQYVAFVKEKHPEWYQGFRVNSTVESAEFKMRAATRCDGHYENLKDAKADQEAVVKNWNDRYAKDKNNGPVVMDDEFVYKP